MIRTGRNGKEVDEKKSGSSKKFHLLNGNNLEKLFIITIFYLGGGGKSRQFTWYVYTWDLSKLVLLSKYERYENHTSHSVYVSVSLFTWFILSDERRSFHPFMQHVCSSCVLSLSMLTNKAQHTSWKVWKACRFESVNDSFGWKSRFWKVFCNNELSKMARWHPSIWNSFFFLDY